MTQTLAAAVRTATGKGYSRKLRTKGLVPAIIYGGNAEETMIEVPVKELGKLYETGHFFSAIVNLNVGKETIQALPRDIQLHPVTDRIEHVDFQRVQKDVPVRVAVSVKFTNKDASPGLKRGGVLNIVRREVELFCAPNAIPAFLEANLDGIKIGQSIHISHVKLPEGAKPVISDRDFTIAAVAGRVAKDEDETAATPAEGAAATPAAKA